MDSEGVKALDQMDERGERPSWDCARIGGTDEFVVNADGDRFCEKPICPE